MFLLAVAFVGAYGLYWYLDSVTVFLNDTDPLNELRVNLSRNN